MQRRTVNGRRAVAAFVLVGAISALAQPLAPVIPLGSAAGDAFDGPTGAPVALTSVTFLVAVEGPDGEPGSSDDGVLLAKWGRDGTVTKEILPAPFLPEFDGGIVRLGPTRAVTTGAGDDGVWRTSDDVVHVFDRLGAVTSTRSVTVGYLDDVAASVPEPIGPDDVVVASVGPDGVFGTQDDRVVVIRGASRGGEGVGTSVPYLNGGFRSRPVRIGVGSFLVASNGPDRTATTADDLVYLYSDVGGGVLSPSEFPTPRLFASEPGRPVALTEATALVVSAGADGIEQTADDRTLELGTVGRSVSPGALGSTFSGEAGRPVALSASAYLVSSPGLDGAGGTVDDCVLVRPLGGQQSSVTVGSLDAGVQCRPVRLSDTSAVVATGGPDRLFSSSDDTVAVLSGVTSSPNKRYVTVASLAGGAAGRISALGVDRVIVSTGGPDGYLGEGYDDSIVEVPGLTGTSGFKNPIASGLHLPQDYTPGGAPTLLGNGRAVVVSTGNDGYVSEGLDDGVGIATALTVGASLSVTKLTARFSASRPDAPATFAVEGRLIHDDLAALLASGVVVRVGDATASVLGGAFVERRGTFKFRAPAKSADWLKSVVIDARKGTIKLTGKGAGTGIDRTPASFVVVALEGLRSTSVDDVVAARATPVGLTYRSK